MTQKSDAIDTLVNLAIEAERSDREGRADRDEVYELFLKAFDDVADPRRAEAFERSHELLRDSDPVRRGAAADLLGRLGSFPTDEFQTQAVAGVMTQFDAEDDACVLAGLVYALGHLADDETLPAVIRLANHASEDVRLAVAGTLPSVAGDPPDSEAVDALVALSRDTDEDVRDWATFGLGSQLEVDSPEVRQALLDRLGDQHDDTRAEAVMGLAVRKDERVITHLAASLQQSEVGTLEVRAASEIGDPRLYEPLMMLSKWWPVDEAEVLRSALEACRR